MGRKDEATGFEDAAPAGLLTARRSDTVIEGGEAVDLYVRQIARNITKLEKQLVLLREACEQAKRSLPDAD